MSPASDDSTQHTVEPLPTDRPTAQAAYTDLSQLVTALIDTHLRQDYPDWPGTIILQRTTVQTLVALLGQFQTRMGAREVALCLDVLRGALRDEVAA